MHKYIYQVSRHIAEMKQIDFGLRVSMYSMYINLKFADNLVQQWYEIMHLPSICMLK